MVILSSNTLKQYKHFNGYHATHKENIEKGKANANISDINFNTYCVYICVQIYYILAGYDQ